MRSTLGSSPRPWLQPGYPPGQPPDQPVQPAGYPGWPWSLSHLDYQPRQPSGDPGAYGLPRTLRPACAHEERAQRAHVSFPPTYLFVSRTIYLLLSSILGLAKIRDSRELTSSTSPNGIPPSWTTAFHGCQGLHLGEESPLDYQDLHILWIGEEPSLKHYPCIRYFPCCSWI